jgi:hypothetical protein
MRNIATAQYKRTVFNIWQRANGELWMHGYFLAMTDAVHGIDEWTDPTNLQMTLPAINNTPIAAATWQVSDYFVSRQSHPKQDVSNDFNQEIRIHYTSTAPKHSPPSSSAAPQTAAPVPPPTTSLSPPYPA